MYAFELVGEADAFAAYEAARLADGVRTIAPGIALATKVSPHVDQLGLTHVISEVVCRTPGTVAGAVNELASSDIDRAGSVAVRARRLRGATVDTQAAERALGTVLVNAGMTVDLDDPTHELRALFSGGRAILGWREVVPGDAFSRRRPTDRPFFQPGSMSPRFARALVNIAGARPGSILLDPMCGTGGSIIEAGRIGAVAIGMDVQWKMVSGARENLEELAPTADSFVMLGDATRLPVQPAAIDAVVVDVPYGRQSRVEGNTVASLTALVLNEIAQVTNSAVVVSDRSLGEAALKAGWNVRAHFARPVHRSLTRHVHHLQLASGTF